MGDNIRVIDCRVDELQANLNLLTDPWAFASFNWYERGEEQRVSVVLTRLHQAPIQLPSGLDLRGNRRN
jgi:hypothetical protein